ncbi:MAG: putative cell cycle control protein [Streblomastix strix]|uniref:Putative cell cycle control protein n=1 Tax=Streblomastix strix TaxID=222440 RepID=A0A5J4W6E9_9EUKA|nr:MAG: putative cell cycle control protein [Streblomastix strix]
MNKPTDNKFWQQHLPGCFLIMTPKKVIISFLTMGITFFLVGIILFITNSMLFTVNVQYDLSDGIQTTKTFDVSKTIKAPIFIHYSIHAFYQNHRKFVNYADHHAKDYMFSDTIVLANSQGTLIDIDQTDLLTVYDKKRKDFADLNQSEIVWMKTATLPTFKKLYGIVRQDMQPGQYMLLINNTYQLPNYSRKEFCIDTTNGAGGTNYYLPIIYTATGAIITGLGLIFIIIELSCGRKLGEKHSKFQISIPRRFLVAKKMDEKEQQYEQGTLKRTPRGEKLSNEQMDIPLHLLTTEDCAKYYQARDQSGKNSIKKQRMQKQVTQNDATGLEKDKEKSDIKKTQSHAQFNNKKEDVNKIKRVKSVSELKMEKEKRRVVKKQDDKEKVQSARLWNDFKHQRESSELTLEMIMPKVDD